MARQMPRPRNPTPSALVRFCIAPLLTIGWLIVASAMLFLAILLHLLTQAETYR